ncbi:MAG: hypothetical protein ACOCUF_02705 [Patescibacteria group bacterium]
MTGEEKTKTKAQKATIPKTIKANSKEYFFIIFFFLLNKKDNFPTKKQLVPKSGFTFRWKNNTITYLSQ